MLNIEKKSEDKTLTLVVSGRIDTMTAPEFEKVIREDLENVETLILDFENLDYISSAGLRVILTAQKIMRRQGEMKIVHVNEVVSEVFEVTGFSDILTIE